MYTTAKETFHRIAYLHALSLYTLYMHFAVGRGLQRMHAYMKTHVPILISQMANTTWQTLASLGAPNSLFPTEVFATIWPNGVVQVSGKWHSTLMCNTQCDP